VVALGDESYGLGGAWGRVIDGPDGIARTGKRSEERVVVCRGDGVELVVVAAGAGDCETEEGFGEHVDLIVDHLELMLADVDR